MSPSISDDALQPPGGALPGLSRPRRARVGPCSHRARDRATAGSGPLDFHPAAPLLGGLFLLPTRSQGKPETDSICVHRPRTAHYPQDRKSTRLNSSHTVISYAVFCLKKKKKKKQ